MSIGFSDRFLVNGYELSGYMQSFEPQAEAEAIDATVLNSTYRAYQQGFKNGTLEWSGVFDADATDTDRIHDVMKTAFNAGTENVVTAGIGAFSVGSNCFMVDGCLVEYSLPIEIGELITVSGSFQSSNAVNFGQMLMSSAQLEGTNNGTSVDGGAATSNGGLLHVHLNNDDATDVDVKLQDSANNTDWADVTGAAVSNLSAEYASGSIAVTGTIRRYIRAVATVAGGDTLRVSVAFARR